MLEKLFKLQENNTSVKTEVLAGITTFMTMAYILAINPSVLSDTGMDKQAVLIATCLVSFIGTMLMALLANLPFALSAGMGLNVYFAYTVCGKMGYPWQTALFAVFIEGIIFIVLSVTNVREAVFDAIPLNLKKAVSAGIGLYITFIGLQNAGLAVDSSTLVTITDFTQDFSTSGITALLAVIGTFITFIIYIRNVKGSILIGIIITWALSIICEIAGVYVPDAETGFYSVIPHSIIGFDFAALGKTAGQCFQIDFGAVGIVNFIIVIFAFLFVDLFDTLGTLIGVSAKAGMLDKDGKLPGIKPALLSDAITTTAGAILGTSTATTFVESSAGVAEGGRTGLTALVTGVLFLISVIFAPLFTAIPSFATAPALIVVGFLMFGAVTDIKFDGRDLTDEIPAFLCIIAMPLFYSMSEGIAIGIISFALLKLTSGRGREVKPLMYVLAVLFILKYIFL